MDNTILADLIGNEEGVFSITTKEDYLSPTIIVFNAVCVNLPHPIETVEQLEELVRYLEPLEVDFVHLDKFNDLGSDWAYPNKYMKKEDVLYSISQWIIEQSEDSNTDSIEPF